MVSLDRPNLALYEGGAYAVGHQVNNAQSMIYAVEGGCFVVAACALVSKEQQDILCAGDPAREALCPVGGGYTKIYAPDGQSIGTGIAHTEEGLVTADIDLSMIAYAKAAADPAGHYSRSDVTRLMLNAKPHRPVMAFDETSGLVTDLAPDVPSSKSSKPPSERLRPFPWGEATPSVSPIPETGHADP